MGLGLLSASIVVAAGATAVQLYERPWVASASLLVVPVEDFDAELAASFYEQLSNGRVVQTYAEVLSAQHFVPSPSRRGGTGIGDAGATRVSIEPVTETSLLRVRATAASSQVAEQTADRVARASRSHLAGLQQPYELVLAAPASGSAERDGLSHQLLYVLVALAALSVGLVVQQLTRQVALSRAARGSRRQRTDVPEDDPSAPESLVPAEPAAPAPADPDARPVPDTDAAPAAEGAPIPRWDVAARAGHGEVAVAAPRPPVTIPARDVPDDTAGQPAQAPVPWRQDMAEDAPSAEPTAEPSAEPTAEPSGVRPGSQQR